jgi:hypothetical protein
VLLPFAGGFINRYIFLSTSDVGLFSREAERENVSGTRCQFRQFQFVFVSRAVLVAVQPTRAPFRFVPDTPQSVRY